SSSPYKCRREFGFPAWRRRSQLPFTGTSAERHLPPDCSLLTGTVEIDPRKIADRVLTDGQRDAVFVHRFHGRYRDGYLLAAQKVTFFEYEVGHVMVSPVDDQPLDLAHPAIGCEDLLAPLDGHLADRQGVYCHRHDRIAPEVGPQQHIFGVVSRIAFAAL